MLFHFGSSEEVEANFPTGERPAMRKTFMLVGVAVHLSAAPTTAEDIKLSIRTLDPEVIFLVKIVDPSVGALTDWVWTLDGSPIPVDTLMSARLEYANTDAAEIDVRILGYWL